jgi:hypothetical protein
MWRGVRLASDPDAWADTSIRDNPPVAGGFVMAERRQTSARNEMRFAAATHQRWMASRNRLQEAPDYKDERWGSNVVTVTSVFRYWVR